jgi:signal transduction histidine kinase
MGGANKQSKPSFRWQVMLILLPLIVLSGLGWFSLRQDWRLARQEAALRAQEIADTVLQVSWIELTSGHGPGTHRLSFQTDDQGRLVFPPPYDPLPTPRPLDVTQLTPEQARLWERVQSFRQSNESGDAVVESQATESQTAFLETNPPADFAASTLYEYALRLAKAGKTGAATAVERILTTYPKAVGESGIPISVMAQYQILRLRLLSSSPGTSDIFPITFWNSAVESFCSNAVCNPTPLTPQFLDEIEQLSNKDANSKATCQRWRSMWEDQEVQRRLYDESRPYLKAKAHLLFVADKTGAETNSSEQPLVMPMELKMANSGAEGLAPHFFWIDGLEWTHPAPVNSKFLIADHNWLAVHLAENATNHWFVFFPESELGVMASRVASLTKPPEYLGVGLEIAGKPVKWFAPDVHEWSYISSGGGKSRGGMWKTGTSEMATVLASANRTEAGSELLKVSVYLTSPSTLFYRQRIRVGLFSSLILAATVAAFIGLTAAWRSFQRQLRLSELKSNFVSSVSHELRAPIASVRLLAESLERGKVHESAKQTEYYRFIVQECRRLSSLIENVLDFSRIEQGRKQYELEPTNVKALLHETLKLMEPYAADKGVALALQTPETDSAIAEWNLDGRAIQQALVNLIDNAIKHSPKGEKVTINCEVTDAKIGEQIGSPDASIDESPLNSEERPTLTLSVSDHGPGIPIEEREKIFDRFYRLGSELRRETQGVGIGLSIVKHIVGSHGGLVRVEGEVGKGSRFIIELPMNPLNHAERGTLMTDPKNLTPDT